MSAVAALSDPHPASFVLTLTVVFPGWHGKPSAGPGWDPPGGNLRVFPASVRERDPVQKGKLPLINTEVSVLLEWGWGGFTASDKPVLIWQC